MLTIVDKPAIQHVVDEARAAGIEHFVFVTGRNKGAIEDHFDIQFELDRTLRDRSKTKELDSLAADLPGAGQTSFTRQQAPLGLGHAVWCARQIIGDEPFALLLPDMLHYGKHPCLKGMIEDFDVHGGNIVAAYAVPESETSQYGIVGVRPQGAHQAITEMVEKPKAGTAPSNLAISGRYILRPEIFDILETQERGAGGEIQLTDAMIKLAKQQDFYAYHFDGEVFDTGMKIGFLLANMALGLDHAELGGPLRAALQARLK